MARNMEFEWPELAIQVTATLLEEDEPELSARLWDDLTSPTRFVCRHTLSTGYEFGCETRPPKHPVESGTQAEPVGRKQWLLCRIRPGSVVYSIAGGYGGITIFYGPCTEPLPMRGPVVAYVEPKDMDNLVRAGKAVWSAQYMTHLPVIMIARRVSDDQ